MIKIRPLKLSNNFRSFDTKLNTNRLLKQSKLHELFQDLTEENQNKKL
jgi:hypothetical protein